MSALPFPEPVPAPGPRPAPGRRSTPRPVHDGPTLVRYAGATHHVWGDDEAGYVTDRVVSSSDLLHVLEYQLAPGGEFRHSPANPTVFAADVLYAVVEGELVLADPSTGEVRRVPAGEAVLFHRDTWHNGFKPSAGTVRVLEFFAPPPSLGTASTYARTRPYLDDPTYADDRWAGRWPAAAAERAEQARLHQVGEASALWRFRQDSPKHLVGVLADTPYLTVWTGLVQPGSVDAFDDVTAESVVVVTEGELWVDVWTELDGYSGTRSLQPGDAMVLPVGCRERLLVRADRPARYLRGSGRVPPGWTP